MVARRRDGDGMNVDTLLVDFCADLCKIWGISGLSMDVY